MMASELTRDEFKNWLLIYYERSSDGRNLEPAETTLLAHDAALRQRVEALEQELDKANYENAHANEQTRRMLFDGIKTRDIEIQQLTAKLAEAWALFTSADSDRGFFKSEWETCQLKLEACEQERDQWKDKHEYLDYFFNSAITERNELRVAKQSLIDTKKALQRQLQQREETINGLDNDVRVLFLRIEELRNDLQEREETIARYEKVLSGEAIVKSLHYEPGSPLDIALSHPMQASIVAGFADMLEQSGAENYLEMRMTKDEKQFVCTIQRAEKPTAHELRRKAEAELTTQRARLDVLEKYQVEYAGLIAWLLGENGHFPERPEKQEGKIQPLYWWRTELRRRFKSIATREKGEG